MEENRKAIISRRTAHAIQKVISLIVVLSVILLAFPINQEVHAALPTTAQTASFVSRSDGIWFWPLPTTYYNTFSDWAGCPGWGTCVFCGTTHPAWGDDDHNKGQGYSHNGFDVYTNNNKCDVYAAASGTAYLSSKSANGGRGYYIVVEHSLGNGWSYYSYYQHLSDFSVSNGASVAVGQPIGKVGGTGGTAIHLHFGMVLGKSGLGINAPNTLEAKGWVLTSGLKEGQIVVNPALNSPAGFPTGYSAVVPPLRAHAGSVMFTFNKNDVTIGSSQGENIGDDFYAFIILNDPWLHLEAASNGNVQVAAGGNNSYDPKQIWHFIRQSDNSYKIVNEWNGYCLDADNHGTANGTNVKVWTDNGSTAQRWFISGYQTNYNIRPSYIDNKVLDVSGALEAGRNIQLYTKNGTAAQKFNIYKLTQDGVTYSKPAAPQASRITNVTQNGTKTTISWSASPTNGPFDSRIYDLRLWQGTTIGDYNNPYFKASNLTGTSYTTELPDGTYIMFVTAYNSKYSELYSYGYDYTTTIKTIVNVECRLNGGSWPSGVNDPSGQYNYGSKISLPTPVRTGYDFVGWNVDLVGSGHILEPWGVPLNAYPSFSNSMGDALVYNNSSNGTVTLERVARTSDCPTSSSYMLKVTTAGTATPGLGGFVQSTRSKANGVFYHIIVAKIPKGYQINFARNQIGDGATQTWLTPQDGTGEFETYIYKTVCGTAGTFSTFGYAYLRGAEATSSNPVSWYVAYAEMYDATSISSSGNSYTVGNAGGTLSAMWRIKQCNVSVQLNGGSWPSGASDPSGQYKFGTKINLPTPERAGYEFVGWNVDLVGSGHILEPWGIPLHADPSFSNSKSDIQVYNNLLNGTVTVERVTKSSDCPTQSPYMLKVKTAGEASPWNGGFYQLAASKASGVFYHVIIAKIPEGYKIERASNATGDASVYTWLTPQDGTGKFETYIYKTICGATGRFSTLGHVYLIGSPGTEAEPLIWYVGYSEVFDGTGVSATGNSYTVGNDGGTLTAMWRENCSVRHDFRCTVSTNPTTGKTGTLTGTCVRCGETTTITLPKLNKTDYTYVVIQPSTCSFNGTACYTWNTTEYGTFSFNRALALAPHSYEDVITPPSCTAQGYTTHTCTVCGTTITDSETPALDHAWNSGVVTKQPTATQAGVKTFTCTRCGQTRTEAIPPTGPTDSYTVIFKPNQGSGSMDNQVIPRDTYEYLTKNTFTRTGYTFSGWNTKANGTGDAVTNGKRVKNLTTEASITLYAQWKPNTYTVKYSANGGTGTTGSYQATYGTYFNISSNAFTRAGYVFSKWNDAADGSGTSYSEGQQVRNLAPSGTKTLYAQWTPNTYTVVFSANGGTGTMGDLSMTYGVSTALTANAFTRTGYSFTGWNTKSNGSGTAYSNGKAVKNLATGGTVTLYAQWKPNTYTIRYNANGGTGSMTSQPMTYGVYDVLTSNVFTRNGYTFNGWNTKADGSGTAYTDGKTVRNVAASGIVTLYAQWKPNTYTVKFNANGGSGSMANQTMTYGVSTGLRTNGFTRTGYTFSGWNTMANGSGTAYSNGKAVKNLAVSGTVTLYAQWKPNTYTIKYSANGGTGTMSSQTATYNQAITLRTHTFTRTGYTFSGWNTAANGSGTVHTDGESVKNLALSGTVTLYAQWMPNPYTIVFNANGGTGSMARQAMTYGVSAALPANTFTRTGYTFGGWNTKADGSGTSYSNGYTVKNVATGGTVTLYAKWKPNVYSIKYNSNGGTGTMAVQKLTYDVSAALTSNAFTRTGYTFTGWNTAADGSGTAFTNGKTVLNLALSGTVTLYAQWKANTYTVKFYSNGGTGTMSNQTMTYNVSSALKTNAFTRSGYTFTGWNTAADGSGTAYTNGKLVKNLATSGTFILYAQWKKI